MQAHYSTQPAKSNNNSQFVAGRYWEAITQATAISKISEAATALMTAFGVPPKRRGLILALIGLSRGRPDDFPASHLQVGKTLYPFDDEAPEPERLAREADIQGQVKRELKRLEAWQAEAGITLVSFVEGARIDERSIPTTYRLHILPLIQATLTEFAALRRRRVRDAMRRAAETIAGERGAEVRDIATRRKRAGLVIDPERYRKQAVTMALKYADESAEGWSAYEKLIDELQSLREEVRRKHNAKFPKKSEVRDEKGLISNDLQEVEGGSPAFETAEPEGGALAGPEPENGSVPLSYDPQREGGNSETVVVTDEDYQVETDYTEIQVETGQVEETADFPTLPADDAHRTLALFEAAGLVATKAVWLRDDAATKEDKLARSEPPVKGAKLEPGAIRANLAGWIEAANLAGQSFAVRWEGPAIQVDDCDSLTFYRLKPYAFVGVETSMSNYQAWIAIAGDPGPVEVEAIKKRLLNALEAAGTPANGGAYGSMRWPGSHNCKPSRRTEYGGAPLVKLVYSRPGRTASIAEIEALCAEFEAECPPEKREASPPPLVAHHTATRATGENWWPDYGRCLADAPLAKGKDREGLPDRSRADSSFVTISLQAGRSPAEVEAMLAAVSEKAREEKDGKRYVSRTVARQVAWLGL